MSELNRNALLDAEQRADKAERRVAELQEEIEILEESLSQALPFYTAAEYNNRFKMHWTAVVCQVRCKELENYCRDRYIKIRNSDAGNSYPLTAWEALLGVDTNHEEV